MGLISIWLVHGMVQEGPNEFVGEHDASEWSGVGVEERQTPRRPRLIQTHHASGAPTEASFFLFLFESIGLFLSLSLYI